MIGGSNYIDIGFLDNRGKTVQSLTYHLLLDAKEGRLYTVLIEWGRSHGYTHHKSPRSNSHFTD